MEAFVPVAQFFRTVYLVDFSPSLCQIAKTRFERLGWKNIKVICQDARYFKLEDYEDEVDQSVVIKEKEYENSSQTGIGADLITMSYALSMIPEFYPVIDALSSLLSQDGIVGVCDFYVQNQVDYRSRNYTGGVIDRHCNWLSRTFWRTWFEVIFHCQFWSERRLIPIVRLTASISMVLVVIIWNIALAPSLVLTPEITSLEFKFHITSG
jgi:betaine lipid synthase